MSKKFLFLSIFSFFLLGFTVGEFAELDQVMNARSSANFLPQTQNVRFQAPKGTVGQISKVVRFQSGNYGVEMDLKNHRPGEKVWIYFTPQKPNMKFFKENPLEKKETTVVAAPAAAAFGRVEVPSPAIARAPQAVESAKKGTDAGKKSAVISTPGTAKDEVRSAVATMERLNGKKSEPCPYCQAMQTGGDQSQECSRLSETIGNITLFRSYENGQCRISLTPVPEIRGTWKRTYRFSSNGHLETGNGLESSTRGYFFFPRKNQVSYTISDDKKTITVQTTSDVKFKISTETGKIVDITNVHSWLERGMDFDGDGQQEKGQVEIIPKADNPVLDLGYILGGTPEYRPQRSAHYRVGPGKSCRVQNNRLFNYVGGGPDAPYDSVNFKFSRDQDFLNEIRKACPP